MASGILLALLLLVQAPPLDVKARVSAARTLLKEGKYPEAVRQLELLQEEHPGDPEAQYEAGSVLQDLAGSAFSRMARVAPQAAETHELLGKYHEARGRLPEALAEYRLALARKPNGSGLHFLIGNILWRQHEFDAALVEFYSELKANPNHSMANHRAGNILLSRGEVKEAIPLLERAVSGSPEFLDGRRDLGKALRLAGRPRDALPHLSFVAGRRPDDDSVHAQLAAVYRALGDTAKAGEELRLHRRILEQRADRN